MDGVTVYGKYDCEGTTRVRDHLAALSVGYDYIDIAKDSEAAAEVMAWGGGTVRTPCVMLEGGPRSCDAHTILVAPDNTTLDAALDRQRLLPLAAEGDGSIGM